MIAQSTTTTTTVTEANSTTTLSSSVANNVNAKPNKRLFQLLMRTKQRQQEQVTTNKHLSVQQDQISIIFSDTFSFVIHAFVHIFK
jgi:hypothetical protein